MGASLSSLPGLLAAVRASPSDRALRHVLADALIEAGDPRGPLMAAELAGDVLAAEAAFAANVTRVRRAVLPADRLVIDTGLLTEIELPFAAVDSLDAGLLAREPLARVIAALPEEPQRFAELVPTAGPALARTRGLSLVGTVDADRLGPLRDLIDAARPEVLALDLEALAPSLDGLAWPSVAALRCAARNGATALAVLAAVPGVRRLAITAPNPELWLPRVLERPALVELDLIGIALSDPLLAALVAWQRPDRRVRHERFDLRPPAPLDDVFGSAGREWRPGAPLVRRVAAAGRQTVLSRDRELQRHEDGDPAERIRSELPVTALGASDGAIWCGREDGTLEWWRPDSGARGRESASSACAGPIRSVHVRGDDLAVRCDIGWRLRREGAWSEGTDRLDALVLLPRGVAFARGAALYVRDAPADPPGEEEIVLDQPILALATDGEALFAATRRRVWRIDRSPGGPARATLLGARRSGRAALSVSGNTVAWIAADGAVDILRDGERTSAHYPDTYTHDGSALRVSDVTAAADGTVTVVLEGGGANLLLADGSALKADEFPGEPRRRWIFLYGGQILVAG